VRLDRNEIRRKENADSRQAELIKKPPERSNHPVWERYPSRRGFWQRSGPGSQNLYEGPGRLLVDEIAEELRALIETDKA
jgi:hypothetical protein